MIEVPYAYVCDDTLRDNIESDEPGFMGAIGDELRTCRVPTRSHHFMFRYSSDLETDVVLIFVTYFGQPNEVEEEAVCDALWIAIQRFQ